MNWKKILKNSNEDILESEGFKRLKAKIDKRFKERDDWWNSLTPEQKQEEMDKINSITMDSMLSDMGYEWDSRTKKLKKLGTNKPAPKYIPPEVMNNKDFNNLKRLIERKTKELDNARRTLSKKQIRELENQLAKLKQQKEDNMDVGRVFRGE